jgi:hypothetical protein
MVCKTKHFFESCKILLFQYAYGIVQYFSYPEVSNLKNANISCFKGIVQ